MEDQQYQFYQFELEYPEFEMLRKIFKLNIQIIDTLIYNVNLLEQNNQINSIKHI